MGEHGAEGLQVDQVSTAPRREAARAKQEASPQEGMVVRRGWYWWERAWRDAQQARRRLDEISFDGLCHGPRAVPDPELLKDLLEDPFDGGIAHGQLLRYLLAWSTISHQTQHRDLPVRVVTSAIGAAQELLKLALFRGDVDRRASTTNVS